MKKASERSVAQNEALKIVAEGAFVPSLVFEDDGWYARWLPLTGDRDGAVAGWVDEYVRSANTNTYSEDAEDREWPTLHDAWMAALTSETGLVRGTESECAAFSKVLEDWASSLNTQPRSEICFSLSKANGKENFELSCPVPVGFEAMRAVGFATSVWGPLRRMRAIPDKKGKLQRLSVELEKFESEDFLRRGARELISAGYKVDTGVTGAEITVAAEVRTEGEVSSDAETRKKAELRLTIKVDGEPVTAEEIRFLLEQKSTLVFFHDRWIEIDPSVLREALRALERCGREKVDPLAFALGIGAIGRLQISEAFASEPIAKLINELRQAVNKSIDLKMLQKRGFKGTLRDYQARGAAWISFLTERGFGALLADDMGLGKTVQTIVWLLSCRDPKRKHPSLIIAPLTLLENWRHEFAAFTPDLRIYVHHGEQRHVASGFRRAVIDADVVITSYNLLVRDHSCFTEVEWNALVVDEAQTIKNADTRSSRAVRAIAPSRRLALTGTPVENSVADVWSIEEFLNPGFLGDKKEFVERFVKPLSADPLAAAGERLRKALSPFVLRRLKSDPAVAAELGEKRIVREYCELSTAQRAEYEDVLAAYRVGERRQGDIFALLTALKLVCDGLDEERVRINPKSGKLLRLFDLLSSIYEAGESVLIFTQFTKVGFALKKAMEERFGKLVPYLHGGLTADARTREIERFNAADSGPSAFILSLRAGGYGLNLIKATHVIHFDRWWNPAVENQATDRAYRIGQNRNVFVHEFISAGTLEEHIDDILEKKLTLESLIKDGEAFIRAISLDAKEEEEA